MPCSDIQWLALERTTKNLWFLKPWSGWSKGKSYLSIYPSRSWYTRLNRAPNSVQHYHLHFAILPIMCSPMLSILKKCQPVQNTVESVVNILKSAEKHSMHSPARSGEGPSSFLAKCTEWNKKKCRCGGIAQPHVKNSVTEGIRVRESLRIAYSGLFFAQWHGVLQPPQFHNARNAIVDPSSWIVGQIRVAQQFPPMQANEVHRSQSNFKAKSPKSQLEMLEMLKMLKVLSPLRDRLNIERRRFPSRPTCRRLFRLRSNCQWRRAAEGCIRQSGRGSVALWCNEIKIHLTIWCILFIFT